MGVGAVWGGGSLPGHQRPPCPGQTRCALFLALASTWAPSCDFKAGSGVWRHRTTSKRPSSRGAGLRFQGSTVTMLVQGRRTSQGRLVLAGAEQETLCSCTTLWHLL